MVGLDSYAEFDSIPLTTRNIGRNYKAFGNDKAFYETAVKRLKNKNRRKEFCADKSILFF